MKYVRFYEEFSNRAKSRSQGNVVAVFTENDIFYSGKIACREALSALFATPNSPVVSDAVSLDYLAKDCKRIGEARARSIHPALFERLDE